MSDRQGVVTCRIFSVMGVLAGQKRAAPCHVLVTRSIFASVSLSVWMSSYSNLFLGPREGQRDFNCMSGTGPSMCGTRPQLLVAMRCLASPAAVETLLTWVHKFFVPGLIVPLIATVGINNKVTFLEKGGTGFPNSTGAYELDLDFANAEAWQTAWRGPSAPLIFSSVR
jgi:hypothetical protein